MQRTHAIGPREHSICSLRTGGDEIIPPHGGRNACLLRRRAEDPALVALRELANLIVEVFLGIEIGTLEKHAIHDLEYIPVVER